MKEILSLFLMATMLFCLVACTDVQVKKNSLEECDTLAKETLGEVINKEGASSEMSVSSNSMEVSKPDEPNAIEHKHVFSDATCTSAAKCSCGETKGEALGHNFTAATCTSPKKCTNCGIEEGEALGHSFTAATCTSPKKCTNCGIEEGEALGHSFIAATCTSPKKCTNCGIEEGKALGHKFLAATCTTKKTCSVCKVMEGDLAAHKYENGICKVCNIIDEDIYVAEQIKAAEKVFLDYTKYEAALKIIKAALQKCPNNSILESKRDYYQSFAPIDLCDLNPYKKTSSYISCGSSYDNLGNSYKKCLYKSYYSSDDSATYDLSYKYNSFKTTVFMRNDCRLDTYGTIEIIGDKVSLYKNENIDVYGRPFDIEIDVTGVLDLEIIIESASGANIFGLTNCILQRTEK